MEEILIEKVRSYEHLYKVTSLDYRVQRKKNEAWEQIGMELNMSVQECKDMWTRLRNCFLNAIKRRAMKSGQMDKKFPPWRFESQMSFLLPYIESRTTHTNLPSKSEDLVNMIKNNTEMRKERINDNKKVAIPELDEVDMFYLSMSKAVKRLPQIEQVRIRMSLCQLVSDAEIRLLEYQHTIPSPQSALNPQPSFSGQP